ncbi:unnamed protein product [Alternaria sp. RS040]
MATDFINAFRRLQTHERGRALQDLTAELSTYEWRALHAATSSRTFQFDVIGSLPVELVAQIFCLLDPATPYRLQSVSKRWRDTLRSLHVLKASLNQWYQGTVNLQDAEYARCKKKARDIHAFRTGKPSRIYKIIPKYDSDESLLPSNPIYDFKLVGSSLIWHHVFHRDVTPSRSACVLDLDTWHLRVLGGEAREQIMNVFASSEIVVLTTYANVCYVHELRGKQGCKKFRVPNRNFLKNVSCRGRTVACVACVDYHASVYIWEYDSQRGRSFEIRHELGNIFLNPQRHDSYILAPLVQPETQTIIIFTGASRSPTPCQGPRDFEFRRYTYRGECISTHRARLPDFDGALGFERPAINGFVPVDYKESIFAIYMHYYDIAQGEMSLLLRFNEEENDLSVWQGPKYQGKQGSWWDSLAWWRDTCYGDRWDHEAEQRDMIAQMGTSDTKRYVPVVWDTKDFRRALVWEKLNSPIVMNEKYIVRNTVLHFYILCFGDDNEGRWPKKSGTLFDMWELEVVGTRGY